MSHWSSQPGRHILEGSIRNLLAEGLFPLTALITAAILSRRAGVDGYGVLVLAVTSIVWIQWGLNSLFSGATIKHVGAAKDWQPIGTAAVNLQLMVGTAAMLILWLLAAPLSRLLGEPRLFAYLALLALDIPLFCVVQAHRHILAGIGEFGTCALLSAGRWVVRLVLIVGLVAMGLSISAAMLGIIGASIAELTLARRYVRPALFRRVSAADWPLWDYALPLFLSALSVSTFVRIDLFFLKALGGTAEQAGHYGAAQNLAQLPGLLAVSIAPFLLSTLSRVLSMGNHAQAHELSRHALRFSLILVSMAAVVAGTASELVVLVFGAAFTPSASLLAILILGSSALLVLTVSTTILVALGRPSLTVRLTAPLVPLAIIGHLLVVPRLGAVGAALVTAMLEFAAAAAGLFAVSRLWDLGPLRDTLWRSLMVGGFAYVLGVASPVSGAWVLIKLVVVCATVVAGYWALGEWSPEEVTLARSLLRMRIIPIRPSVGLTRSHGVMERLVLQAR